MLDLRSDHHLVLDPFGRPLWVRVARVRVYPLGCESIHPSMRKARHAIL